MALLLRPDGARHRPAGASGAAPAGRSAPPALAALPLFTVLPIGAMTLLLVGAVVAPGVTESLALPLAVAGLLVGVPHGAVDHLVPWWWGGASPTRAGTARRLGCFTTAYLLLALVAYAAAVLAPTPVWVAFLAVSGVHFGRGEVVTWAERRRSPAPAAFAEVPAAAAVGLVVVGLLLWARPSRTSDLLRPVSPRLAELVTVTAGPGLWVVGASVVIALPLMLRRRRWLDAAELALVTATFALAPPLAAFGVWFGTWHAVRHTGRLLDLARARVPVGRQGWSASAARLARAGALPSAVALATVAALWLWRGSVGVQAEVGVLLALTFPHAAVVWALDRREARGRATS